MGHSFHEKRRWYSRRPAFLLTVMVHVVSYMHVVNTDFCEIRSDEALIFIDHVSAFALFIVLRMSRSCYRSLYIRVGLGVGYAPVTRTPFNPGGREVVPCRHFVAENTNHAPLRLDEEGESVREFE
jgi:hypothetical protein